MVTVDQKGIDLIVHLYGPAGQPITEEDALNEGWGPERVVHIAEQTGSYEVRLCAANSSATPGKYQLTIHPPRAPTNRDRALFNAYLKFASARHLAKVTDAAGSLRAAVAAESVVAVYKSLGDSLAIADSCILAASLYRRVGDYEKALDFYLDALPLSRAFGGSLREAKTLTAIGAMYKFLGEPDKAVGYLRRALACCTDQQNGRDTAVMLNNVAAVEEELGNSHSVLDLLNRALLLRRAHHDVAGEAVTLHNIGSIYQRLGRGGKALEFYNRALPLRRVTRDISGEAQTLHNIGITLSELGEHESALSQLNRALQLWRNLSDVRNESTALYGLARAARARGDLQEALARIEEAVLLSGVYRDRIARQDLKGSFSGSIHKYYEFCIDLLMSLHEQHPTAGYDRRAFETSERARARSLVELLSVGRTGDAAYNPTPDLKGEQLRLQAELASAARRHSLAAEERSSEERQRAQQQLDALTSAYRKMEAQLFASYGARGPAIPLKAEDIQERALDGDTLLLEYSLGEKRSFVWTVSRNSVTSYVLPGRAVVDQLVQRLYSRIREQEGVQSLSGAQAKLAQVQLFQAAEQLANMIVRPVHRDITPFRKVIVVADGALHYIPFGMLKFPVASTEIPSESRHIIERHDVAYAPSASAIVKLGELHDRRDKPDQQIAVFADPVFESDDERVQGRGKAPALRPGRKLGSHLPASVRAVVRDVTGTGQSRLGRLIFSRREAEQVLRLFPPNVSMRAMDFKASRHTIINEDLSRFRFLHFATHGFMGVTHPELSGLAMSMIDEHGQTQDGFVTLADINGLRLNADLVVLSACETGLGKQVKGEGVIGLTQAFLYAGAANVIASRWKVNDAATAELMKRFYTWLITGGADPSDALRKAQLDMQQTKRWASPYFWAGFVIQGTMKQRQRVPKVEPGGPSASVSLRTPVLEIW